MPGASSASRPSLVRNSAASVLRTASGGFLVLVLPAVLVRELGADTYGVWAVGVEVATYLALFDFGALSAVSHFLAGVETDDPNGHGRVMSTMLALQGALVVLGTIVLCVLLVALPTLYSGMPRSLVSEGRWSLGLMGATALVSLFVTTLIGYFLSIHRVTPPAVITFVSRLVGAVLVAVLAIRGVGIGWLAAAWAGSSLAGYLVIAAVYRRLRVPVRTSLVSWPLAWRMTGFCGAYALWILAYLLVVAFDTVIVARIDFSAVAAYASAAGAVSVLTAVYGSALAPLVPLSAQLAAQGDRRGLADVLVKVLRLGGAGMVGAGALLALFADPLLHAWVGGQTADQGVVLLRVLVAAGVVRLVMLPYAALLFGTGEHRGVLTSPLVEGVVNVAVSVWLASVYGPVGVAVGTLAGAVIGAACHLLYNLPRTPSLDLGPGVVLRHGIGGPALVAIPATVALAIAPMLSAPVQDVALLLAAVATVVVVWRWAITAEDRGLVLARLRARRSSRAVSTGP